MLKESNAIESVFDRFALINAHRAWKYIISQDTLTNNVIKETHNLLMVGRPLDPRYRSDWRDVPVRIGYQVKAQPKIVIDSLVQDFCEDISKLDPKSEPILDHIRFESIHPFIDGNGRVGRIIMNWQNVKLGRKLTVYTNAQKHYAYYPIFGGSLKNAKDTFLEYLDGRWKF